MKTYVKPELRYENFAMSESIAAACGDDIGWIVKGMQQISDVCYAGSEMYPGIHLYADNNSNCTQGEPEAYCQTVLTGEFYVTSSSY